jgi:L-alanine-DL-glutamate epimerase-like enolase superfamily enzyme
VFDDLPLPEQGWLTLPETPGLGFEPNLERVAELARGPKSAGAGKG